MPRKARKKSKSGIYHIVIRGHNGQNIFFDDEDKNEFLEILEFCKNADGFLLFAYMLADDHVHFVLREEEVNVANILKHITTKYVRWQNKKRGSHGRLLHDRYLSEPVDSEEELMKVLRYVIVHGDLEHGSPDYTKDPWNVYREYAMLRSAIVETEIIYGLLADADDEAARLFNIYLKLENDDRFIDIGTERIIMTDDKIREIIIEKYGVAGGDLAHMEHERQAEILREMKKVKGVSIRRLARAAGVTKFTAEKA